jgi:hypothetical protein
MLNFPKEISSKNKENFQVLNKERLLSLLRNDIYNLIISRQDENEYYSLDIFEITYNCKFFINEIVTQIITELNELDWKTKLSFGDTGLFIYSTEEPPRSCW